MKNFFFNLMQFVIFFSRFSLFFGIMENDNKDVSDECLKMLTYSIVADKLEVMIKTMIKFDIGPRFYMKSFKLMLIDYALVDGKKEYRCFKHLYNIIKKDLDCKTKPNELLYSWSQNLGDPPLYILQSILDDFGLKTIQINDQKRDCYPNIYRNDPIFAFLIKKLYFSAYMIMKHPDFNFDCKTYNGLTLTMSVCLCSSSYISILYHDILKIKNRMDLINNDPEIVITPNYIIGKNIYDCFYKSDERGLFDMVLNYMIFFTSDNKYLDRPCIIKNSKNLIEFKRLIDEKDNDIFSRYESLKKLTNEIIKDEIDGWRKSFSKINIEEIKIENLD